MRSRTCDLVMQYLSFAIQNELAERERALLIHSAGEKSAVHNDDLSGNEAGGFRREKNCSADQFFRLAETSHWSPSQKLTATIRAVQEARVQISAEQAGCDRIHQHTVTRPLDGQGLCERTHRGLAGAIGRNLKEADEG